MGKATFQDAFDLLCAEKIGGGIHRDVFACRLMPEYVVKVEVEETFRWFGNVHEMKFWSEHQNKPAVAKWLAPCEWLSPDGRILLQRRARQLYVADNPLPERLPAFLADIKRENFGILDNRLVCVDYAINITNPSTRLRKADWS